MIFLAVLLTARLAIHVTVGRRVSSRSAWRHALAAAMVVAGIAHLAAPTPFVQHLPPWVPGRTGLVYGSGVVEILLGGGLATPGPIHRRVGIVLAAYLVAVFPANVYVAVAGVAVDGQPGGIYPWLRLPWQAAFVWLALWASRPPPHPSPHHGVVPRP